eukprot:3367760-Alexandrium_andersonii.AAC.1
MVRSEVLRNASVSECSGSASGSLGREVQRLALLREGRLPVSVRAPPQRALAHRQAWAPIVGSLRVS